MRDGEQTVEREHRGEKPQQTSDSAKLAVIREEVDAALMTVRIALVTYGELTDLRRRLPICREQLQQVRGAMEMLQLSGAVMVLEGMLKLIEALEQGGVALPRSAVDALVHALLQLPVYLDQLERGGHDSPYVVQPLLDELHAARGASPLTHEVLFSPKLEFGGPEAVLPHRQDGQLRDRARRLRPLFERRLLLWMRRPEPGDHGKEMRSLLGRLAEESCRPAVQQLFRMAEAIFLLLEEGELRAGKPLYRLMGGVNQQLKRLIQKGETDLQREPPLGLMRRLLYHIACCKGGDERVAELRRRYRLDRIMPHAEEITRARARLKGPDYGAVRSALSALRGEIKGIRKALDEWLNAPEPSAEGPKQVGDELRQFVTTLEFLGLEVAAETVRRQLNLLCSDADGGGAPDEGKMLEVATSLVMVESVLRGEMEETALAEGGVAETSTFLEGGSRRLRATVCGELISELNRVKVALESSSLGIRRNEVISSLKQVQGALEMMELREAARLIRICHRFVAAEAGANRRPWQEQQEAMAILISGVEFCVEAASRGQCDAEQLLDDARQGAMSLEKSLELLQQQAPNGEVPGEEWFAASIIKASSTKRPAAGGREVREPGRDGFPPGADGVAEEASRELQDEPSATAGHSGIPGEDAEPEREAEEEGGAPGKLSPGAESVSTSPPYQPEEDPELREILSRELHQHTKTIRRIISAALGGGLSTQSIEELQRALHTIRGSALTAGVQQLPELAGRLERLSAGEKPPGEELLQLLRDSCDAFDDALSSRPDEGDPTMLDPLLRRAVELEEERGAAPPEPPPPQQAELELRLVFCDEAEEILERYRQQLRDWREERSAREPMHALKRELHTLKGSARAAGAEPVADISHVLESFLNEVSAQQIPVSDELFGILEDAQWQLLGMVERMKSGEMVADQPDMIRRIREFVAAARGVTPPQEEEPPPPAELLPERQKGGRVVHFPVAGVGAVPQEDAEGSTLPAERFRVRADMLDSLANMAAEAGICRSRIAQLIDGVRQNISELHGTVERLRSQLRRLDMESESRMLSRYVESEEPEQEQFDPLELDRFSRRQTLARGIMESLNDLSSLEGLMGEQIRQSSTLLEQQGKATHQLQEVLGRARLQPFSSHLPRLYRLVEQLCRELGKQVELQVEGASQELDRSMLARLLPAIEHILRNAVVHGIEVPQRRAAGGKPETGRITIELERHGADMLVRIGDDGAGLDLERIRRKGIEAGYLHPDTPFNEEQAIQLIQRAGFSTAGSVTQLAGRGVGLDVVMREVRQLGGTVQIRSLPGEGVTQTLRLPLMRYLSSALLVVAGSETYALPPMSIEGITRIEGEKINRRGGGLGSYVECMGHSYRIEVLAELVGAGQSHRFRDGGHYITILVRVAEQRLAVVVDRILGEREILMKSFGPQLARLRGVPGVTFMDDGSAVMILDLAALVEPGGISYRNSHRAAPSDQDRPRILVVDDSITVRSLMQRFLKRHGMEVLSARDGMEAISLLDRARPDLVLLDVEMPRMNGYELARYIRNSSAIKNTPIIMISSRSGSRHRERALAAGVEYYLGKPYRDEELLECIRRVRMKRTTGWEGSSR